MLDDDKGGGGAVVVFVFVFAAFAFVVLVVGGGGGEGEGGLAREGNGKGFIDFGVVEVRKGVEEILVVFVRDCEFATK